MSNEKKYSFINFKNCVAKNGNQYVGITVDGIIAKPEGLRVLPSGKKVFSFTLPIHNRGGQIEYMFGKQPYTTEDGTIFAKVAVWDSSIDKDGVATRLSNLCKNNPNKNFVLMLTGSCAFKSREYNGNTYEDFVINADDFAIMRSFEKGGSGSSASTGTNESANAPIVTEEQITVPEGFFELNDEDMPF